MNLVRTAVGGLFVASLGLCGFLGAATLVRPQLATVLVRTALRVEPKARSSALGEVQVGASVSVVGQSEEILAPDDGEPESAGEWFRVATSDGREGWVGADAVWPKLPGWPEEIYLLSERSSTAVGRSGFYVLEVLLRGRRSRAPEDLLGVVDLLLRSSGHAVVERTDSARPDWLYPRGLAFDDRCNPPGIVLPAESAGGPREAGYRASLALVVAERDPPTPLPPSPPTPAGAPASNPDQELVEAWLRPRLSGLGLPAWSSRVTSCDWRELDADDDGRARVLGVCTVATGHVYFSALLVARQAHGIFEPRLIRLAPAAAVEEAPQRRYGGRIASPESLISTDLDGNGRRELWLRGWSDGSTGAAGFWLLFFDLGADLLGPFSFSMRTCPGAIAESVSP